MGENQQCFVIMPISDPKDYEAGHFKSVYEDIFIPAINEAGYIPKRADDDKSSSMIQVNIIQDIVESPMAICDLSSKNPNVLFELGIRQAFDLPVVLVQEEGTPRIFDISTINTIDYSKELLYRSVINDRKKITEAILQTRDNAKGINSIVKLLGREPAKKKEGIDDNALLFTMSNQIQNVINKLDDLEIKRNMENTSQPNTPDNGKSRRSRKEQIYSKIDALESRYNKNLTLLGMKNLYEELRSLRAEVVLTTDLSISEATDILQKINALMEDLKQRIEKKNNINE